jgi:NADPH-dependent glutamate synthase beta subunit-like oxidoreductase/NAD-dependent dihydropyrimidine dehydrogenase PreA subunit
LAAAVAIAILRPSQGGETAMGYRVDIDHAGCINCGICMDVCPVEALDMSRPTEPGIETGQGPARAMPWTMEHPVQVGECIGCQICARECPVSVIEIAAQAAPTVLAARQGPVRRPDDSPGWSPLSEVTLESLKPSHPSPWGDLFRWVTVDRPTPWPTGDSLLDDRQEPVAPCQAACPAGTDAGRYVGLVAQGRYDDAYAVAAEVNPFPSVCGWICTAPCESACRRGVLDEPISIRTIKRFAAEHGTLPPIAPPAIRRAERVAIVGGGPAGMSAAYYLARLGYPVTVFEAMPVPGGMMAIGIPSYRLPRDVLQAEIARIVGLGVDLRLNASMGRDFTLGDLQSDGYAAIFLSTGASKSRRLGVTGDESTGVVPATLFLKQVNLGESPRLSGPVVVVGGGSTAMDAARSALRSGAESVVIAYRRRRADMPAQAEEIEAAEREGIAIRTGLVVREVVARDGQVVALRCAETTGPASAGGGDEEAATESVIDLAARTILVAIGEEPDPSILPEGTAIEISGFAGVVADARTMATGQAGVFAGGDVVSGPKTIIDAVAAGRRAAGSIHGYLTGATDPEAEILRTVRYPTAPEDRLTLDLAVRPRARPPLPVVDATTFAPAQLGFDPAVAQAEAGRCFRCDAVDRCPTVVVIDGRGPDDRPAIRANQPSSLASATGGPAVTGGAP